MPRDSILAKVKADKTTGAGAAYLYGSKIPAEDATVWTELEDATGQFSVEYLLEHQRQANQGEPSFPMPLCIVSRHPCMVRTTCEGELSRTLLI